MVAKPQAKAVLSARDLEILEEVKRRTPWEPLDDLFPAQRRFIDDPHRFKAALCGRRAGKTSAIVRWAIRIAKKGGRVAFIALTLDSVRSLFWKPFKELKEQHGIDCRMNETLLEITFPGGGEIKLRGADKPKEIEKIRGVPHDLVAIDEAAYIGSFLETLVEEVIEPSLLDRRGALVMVCTPSASMVGMFYDVTRPEKEKRKSGWSVHEWSILDNTFIPHALEELKAIKARRSWSDATPKFIREYLGRWIRSDEDFVYSFDEERNVYLPDPKTQFGLPGAFDWNYTLSVDIGFRDATAFVVSAFAQNCPTWYVVEAFGRIEMIPSQVAELMIQLRDRYKVHKIVMDCGALGLPIAEEFRARYGLQIQAAEKKEKAAAIELMNSDMINSRVKVPPGCPVIAQWQTLQFDENGLEDPRCSNDLCFAAGTMVLCRQGEISIESVRAGDEVLTRQGWRRVEAAGYAGVQHVNEISLSTGRQLVCTPDHPIWSPAAADFIRADALRVGERLFEVPTWRRLVQNAQSFLARIIGATQGGDTSSAPQLLMGLGEPSFSTAPYGRITEVQSRPTTTYTTSIGTQATTPLKTSSASARLSIRSSIERSGASARLVPTCSDISDGSEPQPPSGTAAQKASSGTEVMSRTRWPRSTTIKSPSSALSVDSNTSDEGSATGIESTTAPTNAGPQLVAPPASTTRIGRALNAVASTARTVFQNKFGAVAVVDRRPRTEPCTVYNVTVAEVHEFFANGVLVRNCDASLYGHRYAKHYLPAEEIAAGLTPNQRMDAYWQKKAREMKQAETQEWWEGKESPFSTGAFDD